MNAKLTAKQTEALQLVATGNVIAIVRGIEGFETINGNTENKLRALKLIEKKAAGTRVRNGFTIEISTWALTEAGKAALGAHEVAEITSLAREVKVAHKARRGTSSRRSTDVMAGGDYAVLRARLTLPGW
jgi:hypothetical protein